MPPRHSITSHQDTGLPWSCFDSIHHRNPPQELVNYERAIRVELLAPIAVERVAAEMAAEAEALAGLSQQQRQEMARARLADLLGTGDSLAADEAAQQQAPGA